MTKFPSWEFLSISVCSLTQMYAGDAVMTHSNELEILTQSFTAICREFDTFHQKARQDNLTARLVYEQNINVLQRCKHRVENYLSNLKSAENDEMRRYYIDSVKRSLTAFKESLKLTKMKVKSAKPIPPFFF